MSLIHSPLSCQKYKCHISPFQTCFLSVFLPLICNRSWTFTMGRRHGYMWVPGEKVGIVLRDTWNMILVHQPAGGNRGAGGSPLNFLQQASRVTLFAFCTPLSTWIGVGHFEGLCPHEKTKDKGMDEGASSYLGTCNLLLQSLVDFGPKRQHWLTLKVSDCGQVVSWHWHNPAWPPNTGKLNRWYRLSAPLYFWNF